MAASARTDLVARLRTARGLDPARLSRLKEVAVDAALRVADALPDLLGSSCSVTAGDPVVKAPGRPVGADTCLRLALRAKPWTLPIEAIVERASLDRLTEIAFGGDGQDPPVEARPVSVLERQIGERIVLAVAEAFAAAFSVIAVLAIEPASVENLDSSSLSPDTMIETSFAIDLASGVATIALLLPQAPLIALRDAFGREDVAIAPAREDAGWVRSLRDGIRLTDLTLEAVLDTPGLTLASLGALEVGRVLAFPSSTPTAVSLRCGGAWLFGGELGQANGAYTVRIADARHAIVDPMSRQQEQTQ